MQKMLSGIYPPIVTPFTADEDVDYEALRFNIKRWNETGLSGYVALGSNGEGVYLSYEEKLRVIQTVAESRAEGKKLIAGTGCESTRETVRLSREAASIGVDGLLLVNPSYYGNAMTSSALFHHYTRIAESVELPLLLYNVPKFTGRNMDPDLVSRLSEHPNIVGIKDSSGNLAQLGEIISRTPRDFSVLVGTAGVLSSAMTLGAAGGILALANIAPDHSLEIVSLVRAGRHKEAAELQLRMIPVNKAVTDTFGIPGLKCALDHLEYRGGYPRLPLQPLNKEGEKALVRVLHKARLL